MKQKVDGEAKAYLKYMSRQFSALLGDETPVDEGIIFNKPPLPLKSVRIGSSKNTFLLGGLFSLQIVAQAEIPGLREEKSPISIGYKGAFIKGRAYFRHENDNLQIIDRLNGETGLIDAISSLDLEKGEIYIKDDKLEIRLSPLSGSYMYMVIPPMRYSGTLLRSDIDGLCKVVLKICSVFKETVFIKMARE